MKLQPLSEALEIWQKDKYIDINNFYYDCPTCEDTYNQQDHTNINPNGNKEDNHTESIYRMYPIQTWNVTGCKTCEIIDYLCNLYYRDHQVNTHERNIQLINEILSYEINAYKLLKQRESFGYIYQQLDGTIKDDEYAEGIHDITHYLYNSKYTYDELESLKIIDKDINKVRIDRARWCSICGARKPDVIFDEDE